MLLFIEMKTTYLTCKQMLKRIFIILSVIFITFSCNNNEAGEIRESIQLSDDWNFVVDSLDKGDKKMVCKLSGFIVCSTVCSSHLECNERIGKLCRDLLV